MLGAQSLPRSMDTSAETMAPLADSTSMIDWIKRPFSLIRYISSSLKLAIVDP